MGPVVADERPGAVSSSLRGPCEWRVTRGNLGEEIYHFRTEERSPASFGEEERGGVSLRRRKADRGPGTERKRSRNGVPPW